MASVTLAESAKLSQNMLVAGVIENIITVNKMYELLPFDAISGNALQYTREATAGDVILGTVGTTFSGASAGKAAATFTTVTSGLTRIMGDAEVDNLIKATRSSDGNDQTAIQIASKAKSVGRKYQDMLVNGTGLNNQFTGLLGLCASGQKVATATDGSPLSFAILDSLMSLVTDKDGQVDYLAMNIRTINSLKALLRAQPGATINETVTLPSGVEVMSYCGTPVIRNDWIPINQTQGAGTNLTTIIAGTFDDGSRQHGITGLTTETNNGIHITDVGEAEDKDEHITRVKFYCGLALFSELGLAVAEGITN